MMPWGEFFTIMAQLIIATAVVLVVGFIGSAVGAAIRDGLKKGK